MEEWLLSVVESNNIIIERLDAHRGVAHKVSHFLGVAYDVGDCVVRDDKMSRKEFAKFLLLHVKTIYFSKYKNTSIENLANAFYELTTGFLAPLAVFYEAMLQQDDDKRKLVELTRTAFYDSMVESLRTLTTFVERNYLLCYAQYLFTKVHRFPVDTKEDSFESMYDKALKEVPKISNNRGAKKVNKGAKKK